MFLFFHNTKVRKKAYVRWGIAVNRKSESQNADIFIRRDFKKEFAYSIFDSVVNILRGALDDYATRSHWEFGMCLKAGHKRKLIRMPLRGAQLRYLKFLILILCI